MLDIGWPELILIAALTVIVIGPKELPVVLRALGRWVGKARALAREFRGSIEEIDCACEVVFCLFLRRCHRLSCSFQGRHVDD